VAKWYTLRSRGYGDAFERVPGWSGVLPTWFCPTKLLLFAQRTINPYAIAFEGMSCKAVQKATWPRCTASGSGRIMNPASGFVFSGDRELKPNPIAAYGQEGDSLYRRGNKDWQTLGQLIRRFSDLKNMYGRQVLTAKCSCFYCGQPFYWLF